MRLGAVVSWGGFELFLSFFLEYWDTDMLFGKKFTFTVMGWLWGFVCIGFRIS